MGKVRLSEGQLIDLISRVIRENSDKDFVTGISASKRAELIDDVINRLNEFGMRYEIELNRLNSKFNPERIKRANRPRGIEDLDLPKGLRIGKTIFPED